MPHPESESPEGVEVFAPDDWDEIPEHLKPKLEAVLTSAKIEMFRSPLLPPEILERYNNVVPGLAGKLVEWTEEETSHRRRMEDRAFDEARDLRGRSQKFGLFVSVFGLSVAGIVGSFSAINSSGAAAAVASITAIVSVGGPFAARVLASSWNKQASDDNE